MKLYTTPDQTTKLIELGFKKPPKKGLLFQSTIGNCLTDLMLAEENYSIGELMEMLPECEIIHTGIWNIVKYDEEHYYGRREIVDALYLLIKELKNEGVL